MQNAVEALSMRDALLLWIKVKAIIATLPNEEDEVSALINSVALFEQELFQVTQNFLVEQFNNLHMAHPTPENVAAGFGRFSSFSSPKKIQNSNPIFTVEINDAMTLAELYQTNISRIKALSTESLNNNNNANIIPFSEKKKWDKQIKQIEASYLNLSVTLNETASLRELTKTVISQHVSLQPLSQLYAAFGEMNKIGDVAEKKCFFAEETRQLGIALQKRIDKKLNPNSPINVSLPNVMINLPQLNPFFSITGDDFFSLVGAHQTIPSLLTTKMDRSEFNLVLTGLSNIIPHYLNVIKLFDHIRQHSKSAEEIKNVDSAQERLSYQITRPSRLLLVLREINKNLTQLQSAHLLSPVASEQAEQFDEMVERLAQHNLYTNAYQAALEAQVSISIRLKKLSVTVISNLRNSDLKAVAQQTRNTSHQFELQRVKEYFDQLLNNKQDAPQFTDYAAITQAINTILNDCKLNFEGMSALDIGKNASLKLLYNIVKAYQDKAHAALDASQIQINEIPENKVISFSRSH